MAKGSNPAILSAAQHGRVWKRGLSTSANKQPYSHSLLSPSYLLEKNPKHQTRTGFFKGDLAAWKYSLNLKAKNT